MLNVSNLTKLYDTQIGRPAGGVRKAIFEVEKGEFYTLLGPSGCGKTTTLRSVAGLEEPDTGHIEIDGRVVYDSESGTSVTSSDRNIGMVFQSYAVWPHMTVFDNVAFPLRVTRNTKYSKNEIRNKVLEALDVVGLADLATRPSPKLSGGQQQRLALARAIVGKPRLLLLDEPLSNLDALLREQMRVELRRLQQTLGITTIYVTHDQSEALAMSDKIAVMNNGEIVEVGSPKEIYYRPNSKFVATFIGKTNLIDGILTGGVLPGEIGTAAISFGQIRCFCATEASAGDKVSIAIRPEDLVLAASGSTEGGPNTFRGRIVNEVFLGEIYEYQILLGDGCTFLARGHFGNDFVSGMEVTILFPEERAIGLVITE
jgi:iron(III) transport system ATP-binding protein